LDKDFQKIQKGLRSITAPDPIQDNQKLSSVVFPIFKDSEGRLSLILTKRSEKLRNHAGQISFPGGVYSTLDKNLNETALREWEEETGESRESIEVLGKYTEIKTRTGYHIVPFVGIYTGSFQFHPNEEVDFLFTMNFSEFQNIPFYMTEYMTNPQKLIYYFHHDAGLIWGATCEMIVRFLRDFLGFDRIPENVCPNIQSPPFFIPPGMKSSPDPAKKYNIYFRNPSAPKNKNLDSC